MLRLSGVQGHGTLYEKFESFLGDLGIQLEHVNDGEAPQEITRDVQIISAQKEEGGLEDDSPRGRPRRASFNSMYDVGEDITRGFERGPRSQSSLSRPQTGASIPFGERVSTRPTTRTTEREQWLEDPVNRGLAMKERDTLNVQEVLEDPDEYPYQIVDSHAVDHDGLHAWRQSVTQEGFVQAPEDKAHHSSHFTSNNLSDQRLRSQPVPVLPPELLYRPSDTQVSLDAEDFYNGHIIDITKRILRNWNQKAASTALNRNFLETKAADHDRGVLISQAFDTWYTLLLEKRRQVETERFFARLERRADKARNLHLLAKAFTHWAQVAHEEVQRTSTARRHILRVRYFNAWRDVSVVNEFKIRRHGLNKFLKLWRDRTTHVQEEEINAITFYESNLVQKKYWRWFWQFCEKRAPEWWADRIKRKTIATWIDAYRERTEREGWMEGNVRKKSLSRCLEAWKRKLKGIQSCQNQAKDFREKKAVSSTITDWRALTILSPPAVQVSNMVDWRVARTTFTTWELNTRLTLHAREVDRLRVMHNAWTAWNDALRCRSLAAKINERVQAQTLYKWVLTERYALVKRLFDRRLKQRILTGLIRSWSSLRTRIEQDENTAYFHHNKKTMRNIWARWRLQMELGNEREQLAEEFYCPSVLSKTLHTWSYQTQRSQELKKVAELAHYYFVARKTIRRWKEAVARSKRQKRREAYARVRRRVKVNLKTKFFDVWHTRTAHVVSLHDQAEAQYQKRLVLIEADALRTWQARNEEMAIKAQEAEVYYIQASQKRHLQVLLREWQSHRQMERQAIQQDQMHVLNTAAVQLRKFSMRVFEHNIRIRSAEDFFQRHTRRTIRNIFRHWRNQTRELRRNEDAAFKTEERNRGGSVQFGATRRPEGWTAFEDDLNLENWISAYEAPTVISTPRPGYLNTPSKRAAHAKALVNLSTTPAGTPRVSPLNRHLWGRSSAGKGPSRPLALGRSVVGQRGNFVQSGEIKQEGEADHEDIV